MAETKQVGGTRLPVAEWRRLDQWVNSHEIHRDGGGVERLTMAKVVRGLLLAAVRGRFPALALVQEALPEGARIEEKP